MNQKFKFITIHLGSQVLTTITELITILTALFYMYFFLFFLMEEETKRGRIRKVRKGNGKRIKKKIEARKDVESAKEF